MSTAPALSGAGQSQDLRAALNRVGFRGDFESAPGARQVASTDNSIYEVLPEAIVYPAAGDDINRIVRAAMSLTDRKVSLTARGGNTGTNGQSLNDGVIIDFARHMNRILDIDVEGRTIKVEPGVVLDQLNRALAPHGLFFPPMVSTASRATIGGMVATDASGKGSRVYGKTSDYIEAMEVVLADGTDLEVKAMPLSQAEQLARTAGCVGNIFREALRVFVEKADAIARVFPDMNRGLTGYNLQRAYDVDRRIVSLPHLLAGSEGTLALTKSVTVRVAPKPRHKALVVLRYDDFDRALRDVPLICEAAPLAVEILDDKVLGVATSDVLWSRIESVLGKQSAAAIRALVFVEYATFSHEQLNDGLAELANLSGRLSRSLIDITTVTNPDVIADLWTLREKSVGLLARLGAGKQGMPFVEDTAVPPARLADYVREFRAILDRHGLQYGMFGHADVGCLHVRPFLDMKDPHHAALVRTISDEVAALTKRYGGLLWGEHGRGYRGEYSPFFFGDELYPELVRIKAAFDPQNRFNPGKLASADGMPVQKIDAVPFRGQLDRVIDARLASEFGRSLACNGNGACFSWDAMDVLCPSYKATRDRAQSPKGRASLLRAWARNESISGAAVANAAEIELAVKRSLDTCLSCKGCATLCPVKVDIPTLKSRFLARYYQKHRRPLAHKLLARVEGLFAIGSRLPLIANVLLQNAVTRRLTERVLSFVDLPAFSRDARRETVPTFSPESIRELDAQSLARTVVLVEDTFTSSFDRTVIFAATRTLQALGYRVFRMPARINGKILLLLGLRQAFARIASQRIAECATVARLGVRLVGLDAATSLMFEQEYREFVPDANIKVAGLETILFDDLTTGWAREPQARTAQADYTILAHCTEFALRPESTQRWLHVFKAFGLNASSVSTGCCGMAGLFGHERRNQDISRRLFELSWAVPLKQYGDAALATGFSCRSQAKRFAGIRPRHPIEVLWSHLSSEQT